MRTMRERFCARGMLGEGNAIDVFGIASRRDSQLERQKQ